MNEKKEDQWTLDEIPTLDLSKFSGVKTDCRECGLAVHAGTMEGEQCILHAQPPCARFLRYDPIDFLRWNRGAEEN